MPNTDPLSIYKLLPKTNCRDCGLRGCLAYAAALLNEESTLEACPHLSGKIKEELAPVLEENSPQEGFRQSIEGLRQEVRELDLKAMAEGLGAEYSDGKLHIKCLGRDFIVLDSGMLESVCHVNVWVELMLLNYCKKEGRGTHAARWVSYGDLPQAAPTAPYFEQRTEEPLRAIADSHTEVFLDLLEIFGGVEVSVGEADHAIIIHPLPKVPFLVLYTRPEDGFESSLRVLLDADITTYLPKEAVTYIGRGIVEMFKKIVSKHEDCTQDLLSR